MNSSNRVTLLMFGLAAVASVVAMVYYPWPEPMQADAEVGQPLFEEYSADQVRGIDIMRYDSETGVLDRIKLARRGEKWVLPARQNFLASNSELVGNVINSLNDRTVFEVVSENQLDHIEYGVVDPTGFSGDVDAASLGQKLVLSDRNDQTIASLIVGLPVKNDPQKRYVRVPGKPRVYLVDFDDRMLTTEFAFWVSPNALQLKRETEGQGLQFRSVQIENYRIADVAAEKPQNRRWLYRATVAPADNQLVVRRLQIPPAADGKEWKTLQASPTQSALLKASALSLFSIFIDDVRRREKELAAVLKNPAGDVDESVFAELPQFGFVRDESESEAVAFNAENGEITVATREGVLMHVLFGKPASANSRSTGKLNHYVMIHASVDAEMWKKPERPAGLADDESEENRQYRRNLEQWETGTKQARQLVRDFNVIHGDWFYLVSEEVIANLRPEIPLPGKPVANGQSEGLQDEQNQSAGDQSEGKGTDNNQTAKDETG